MLPAITPWHSGREFISERYLVYDNQDFSEKEKKREKKGVVTLTKTKTPFVFWQKMLTSHFPNLCI